MKELRILLILFLGLMPFQGGLAQVTVKGKVLEAGSGLPLPGTAASTGSGVWAVTDSSGHFILKYPKGKQVDKELTLTLLGYHTLKTPLKADGSTYHLRPDVRMLDEVVVTAVENRGSTSSSWIGKDAISHIQPSSFADILELLPGGHSKDPAFSGPQIANLRSANATTNSDYATSALGTRFLIDGRPAGNDANLQYTPSYSNLGSSFVNMGTDMRDISTEDIESVEVVRGIASAEYGDLTSGLIKINRKHGGRELSARFKADMTSQLFYLGKGWEKGDSGNKASFNASANFLDSRADPRETRQNWKRLTLSARSSRTWTGESLKKVLYGSLDYTGSFDKQKSDTDLDLAGGGKPVETYRSDYNKFAFACNLSVTPINKNSAFGSWTTRFSLAYERDLIDRWRHISRGKDFPVSISAETGPADAVIVPARYETSLKVDGRPFYAFLSSNASFKLLGTKLKAGAEWSYEKNFGQGSVFDPARPFSNASSTRPRPFSAIPGTHQFSAFVEDNFQKNLGPWKLEATTGLRAEALAGAGSAYAINLKPFLDPRASLRLEFPSFPVKGYKLDYALYGGVGMHSKFPTMDMLYPEPVYGDISQFNYWPEEADLRRVNMYVYKIDPTNFALAPAHNLKMEIGADAAWNGFTLSIDWFREDMKSGFRSTATYMNVIYKDYDESAVDKSALSAPPSLENLPWKADTLLTAYSYSSNGSRTIKQGIEFMFTSKRIRPLGTKVSISGAWLLSKYMNSQPEWWRPGSVIGGKPFPYLGLYESNDGRLYEIFNTNFLFDTQVPRLGLIFTSSFQACWFSGHRSMPESALPVLWMDKKLEVHPFTAENSSDAILRQLVRDYTPSLYEYFKTPFYMYVNLKVSKKLYHDLASVSIFVNRILDITPDYVRNGFIVRRNISPYFGMELDFKI